LQRAIYEKRLAIPPDAVNLDYHAVNVVTVKSSTSHEYDEESWVPLTQVECQFSSLGLEQERLMLDPNPWETVRRHNIPVRNTHGRGTYP